jgi:hypothetical protein
VEVSSRGSRKDLQLSSRVSNQLSRAKVSWQPVLNGLTPCRTATSQYVYRPNLRGKRNRLDVHARAFPYSTSKRLHAFSAFCSL